MYCIEYRTQPGPGNFLADKIFSTEAEAREQLALIWDFKKSHDLVLRKYTIRKDFVYRRSLIGPQYDKTIERTYQGVAIQFEIPDEVKKNWTDYFIKQDENADKVREYINELK
ncbi:hypothetical protein GCM10028808_26060 [Spirosoma migulaei]